MDEIQSWWEVPSVAHFCSLFKTAFDLSDFDIEDLEESLLAEENDLLLVDLVSRLLCGCYGRDDIGPDNFEEYLQDIFKQRVEVEQKKPSLVCEKTFFQLSIRERLEVLQQLCDFRLDADDVVDLLKGLDGDSMRVEPLGIDASGAKYWYFYGTRLYKEDPKPVLELKSNKKRKNIKSRRKRNVLSKKHSSKSSHTKLVEDEDKNNDDEEEEKSDDEASDNETLGDMLRKSLNESLIEQPRPVAARLRVNLEKRENEMSEEDVEDEEEVESIKFDDTGDEDFSADEECVEDDSDEEYTDKGVKKSRKKKAKSKPPKIKKTPKPPTPRVLRNPPRSARLRAKYGFQSVDEDSRDSPSLNTEDCDVHSISSCSTNKSLQRSARRSHVKRNIRTDEETSLDSEGQIMHPRKKLFKSVDKPQISRHEKQSKPSKRNVIESVEQSTISDEEKIAGKGAVLGNEEELPMPNVEVDGEVPMPNVEVDGEVPVPNVEVPMPNVEEDGEVPMQTVEVDCEVPMECIDGEVTSKTIQAIQGEEEVAGNDSLSNQCIEEEITINDMPLQCSEEKVISDNVALDCITETGTESETVLNSLQRDMNPENDEQEAHLSQESDAGPGAELNRPEELLSTGDHPAKSSPSKSSEEAAKVDEIVHEQSQNTTVHCPNDIQKKNEDLVNELAESSLSANNTSALTALQQDSGSPAWAVDAENDKEHEQINLVMEKDTSKEIVTGEANQELTEIVDTSSSKAEDTDSNKIENSCSGSSRDEVLVEQIANFEESETISKSGPALSYISPTVMQDKVMPYLEAAEVGLVDVNNKDAKVIDLASEGQVTVKKADGEGHDSLSDKDGKIKTEMDAEVEQCPVNEDDVCDLKQEVKLGENFRDEIKDEGSNPMETQLEEKPASSLSEQLCCDSSLAKEGNKDLLDTKEEKQWEPRKLVEASIRTGWHLVCDVTEDWQCLADSLKDSSVRCEKALLKTITNDFLPEIPFIQEEKEKERKRRLQEMVPRRISARLLYKKIEQEQADKILQDAAKEEERQKAAEEEERKRKLEEEKLEEQRRLQEEKERAREERAKRVQLREERARLIAEGKEIPLELMNGMRSDSAHEQTLDDETLTKLNKVLTACMKHNEAWPFVEAVEEAFAPGYFDVIKNPIDLSEMENKLNCGKYASKEEFAADMDLLVANSESYNGIDSDFTIMARNVRNAFHRSLRRMFPVVRTHRYEDDGDYIANGKNDSVEKKYRSKREASKRARDYLGQALSEEDSNDSSLHAESESLTYRNAGSNRTYANVTFKGYPESGYATVLPALCVSNSIGYSNSIKTTASWKASSIVGSSTAVLDSMFKSNTRRLITVSKPPATSACGYDMPPPVLTPEVMSEEEQQSSSKSDGMPVPTWSYRRDTKPELKDDEPPKLRRMVPCPITTMLKGQEKRVYVPGCKPQAPKPVQTSPITFQTSKDGITHIASVSHQSGGLVCPANQNTPSTSTTSAPGVAPVLKQKIVHISRADYERLLAQNKLKVITVPGKGQIMQLHASLQIVSQKPSAPQVTQASASASIATAAQANRNSAPSVTVGAVPALKSTGGPQLFSDPTTNSVSAMDTTTTPSLPSSTMTALTAAPTCMASVVSTVQSVDSPKLIANPSAAVNLPHTNSTPTTVQAKVDSAATAPVNVSAVKPAAPAAVKTSAATTACSTTPLPVIFASDFKSAKEPALNCPVSDSATTTSSPALSTFTTSFVTASITHALTVTSSTALPQRSSLGRAGLPVASAKSASVLALAKQLQARSSVQGLTDSRSVTDATKQILKGCSPITSHGLNAGGGSGTQVFPAYSSKHVKKECCGKGERSDLCEDHPPKMDTLGLDSDLGVLSNKDACQDSKEKVSEGYADHVQSDQCVSEDLCKGDRNSHQTKPHVKRKLGMDSEVQPSQKLRITESDNSDILELSCHKVAATAASSLPNESEQSQQVDVSKQTIIPATHTELGAVKDLPKIMPVFSLLDLKSQIGLAISQHCRMSPSKTLAQSHSDFSKSLSPSKDQTIQDSDPPPPVLSQIQTLSKDMVGQQPSSLDNPVNIGHTVNQLQESHQPADSPEPPCLQPISDIPLLDPPKARTSGLLDSFSTSLDMQTLAQFSDSPASVTTPTASRETTLQPVTTPTASMETSPSVTQTKLSSSPKCKSSLKHADDNIFNRMMDLGRQADDK